MARTNRINPVRDLVRDNAPFIRQYAERGETYLGEHPKTRLQSLRVRLQNLKNYAYHHMNLLDDTLCGRVYQLMADAELDYEEVERPSRVKVKYQDVEGKAHEIEADGLLATCLQHEIDHTNGILFIDYISKLKRDMVLKKFKKAAKRGDTTRAAYEDNTPEHHIG